MEECGSAALRVEQRLLANWLETNVPAALAEWHLPVLQKASGWPGWQPTPTPGLLQVMHEARALDRMGCSVPHVVAAAALRQGALEQALRRVGAVLARASAVHASLSEEERVLLAPQLHAPLQVLGRGEQGVTWASLTLGAYLTQCDQVHRAHMCGCTGAHPPLHQAVATLESQIAQIRSHAAPLHDAVDSISNTSLLPPRPLDTPPLSDVLTLVGQHLAPLLPDLQAKHRGMAAALCAVEQVVCGSATGRAPGMAVWYAHWEGALCGALVTMVHNGMSRVAVHGMAHHKQADWQAWWRCIRGCKARCARPSWCSSRPQWGWCPLWGSCRSSWGA